MRTGRVADETIHGIEPRIASDWRERARCVVIEVKHGSPSTLRIPLLRFNAQIAHTSPFWWLDVRRGTVRVRTLSMSQPATSFYKRSNFVTHLPVGRLYSPSHYWLEREDGDLWRIGFTKFATRMLGEIVDHQWEKTADAEVAAGEIIGSIEGFKAISDIYCVIDGTFAGGNELLAGQIELVSEKPYDAGWLYRASGTPDSRCVDVEAYRALLDGTIDRILEKQLADESQ